MFLEAWEKAKNLHYLTPIVDLKVFALCKLKIDDVISGSGMETSHKMKDIPGKNGLRDMLLKLCMNIMPYERHKMRHIVMLP